MHDITYDAQPTIPNTESITVNDTLLVKNIDYIINYYQSSVYLFKNYNNALLNISYFSYHPNWKNLYSVYEMINLSDSLKTSAVKKDPFDFLNQKSNLIISGSKSFSVSVSNQNDLSVNQAMFLNLNGEISENVLIDAQLNDNQSPITPEGDTRELSSIDQIYFKIYGKQYELAFGDLDINFNNTMFINYLNKFEGVKAKYFNKNEYQMAIAISRSKNASLTFYGVNGKQGPYYLKPEENVQSVKVISGTETVFLDSKTLSRGDDYSIDYDEGSITFTNKNFINENNRIQVQFQYSDEHYRKNTYLFNTKNQITDNLNLYSYAIMNIDDKKNPLEYSFTESEITALKNSGDQTVYVSGIQKVEPGFGRYMKVVVNEIEYYAYTEIDSLAEYNVTFTYFGQSKGDYRKLSSNIYEYIGPNQGDYLPLKKIVAPIYKANWDAILDYKNDYLNLNYESMITKFDKNTFSSKDSNDDFAYIQQLTFSLLKENNEDQPYFSITTRNKSKFIASFSELPTSENSDFYLLNYPDSLSTLFISPKVNYNYRDILYQRFYYEWIKNYSYDSHNHYYNELVLKTNTMLSKALLKNIYGTQKKNNNEASEMQEHSLNIMFDLKYSTLSLSNSLTKFINENPDSLINKTLNNSFKVDNLIKFNQSAIQLSFKNELNKKLIDYYRNYNLINTYSASTQLVKDNHYNSISYSKKIIDYQIPSYSDQKYDLLDCKFNNHFFKSAFQNYLQYSVNNLEYYPKIKELQYIGAQGNYDSTGVWTESGGYDWIYFISGSPEQTIDVKLDFSINTNLSNYFKNDILDRIQTETWCLIQENSKEKDKYKVYILNQNYLMNDSTTVYGRQVIRNIIWYNLVKNKLTLKYTYLDDNTFDNRYQQLDKLNKQSHELNLSITKMNNMDFEYTLRREQNYSLKNNEKSDLIGHNILNRYNLNNSYIFNTELEYLKETNDRKNIDYSWINDKWIFKEGIMFFLKEHYRINSNIELSYTKSDYSISNYLPESKREGFSYKLNCQLFYKINQYTQLTVDYNLTQYPKSDIVHLLNVEVKAEF